METMETNIVFPDKNIKRKTARSVSSNSFTLNAEMTDDEKLKIIKAWWEDYKVNNEFNLYLVYNEKTYNLYSFSTKGGDLNIYFTYSDETKTYGFGMFVANIDNEFPTFLSDNPDFDISTLVKQEGTGGTGTDNYDELENKPSINGTILQGNLTSEELGISNVNIYKYKVPYKTSVDKSEETLDMFNEIREKFDNGEKILLIVNGNEYNGSISASENHYIFVPQKGNFNSDYIVFKSSPMYTTNQNGINLYSALIINVEVNGDKSVKQINLKAQNFSLTYAYNIDAINVSSKNKVLTTTNESVFTPTGDYNPATKKYVDDAVANVGGRDIYVGYVNSIDNLNVATIQPIMQSAFDSGASRIMILPTDTSGESFNLMQITSNLQDITASPNLQQIKLMFLNDFSVSENEIKIPCRELRINYKIENEVITVLSVVIVYNYGLSGANYSAVGNRRILVSGSGSSYTPKLSYDPATKKYVDDLVGNINTLLEAI